MGKSTIYGPFSIAMLNYQRVYIYIPQCFRCNVNPGLINPEQTAVSLGGYHKKVSDEMTIGGVSPN